MALPKITYPAKSTGDTFAATEANEIKAVANATADAVDALGAEVDDLSTTVGTKAAAADLTALAASVGTKVTQTEVDSAVNAAIVGIIGGAPGTLNALNELATALGNDPNFATTVASQIGAVSNGLSTANGNIATNTANIAGNTTAITTTLPAAIEAVRTTMLASPEKTAAYVLALVDAGNVVPVAVSSPAAVTVPPNSSVAFPIGTIINVIQTGASQLTITAGAGVTIRQARSQFKTAMQWAEVSLRKRSTDEWVLVGDTAA
jgi:hypothetical protein